MADFGAKWEFLASVRGMGGVIFVLEFSESMSFYSVMHGVVICISSRERVGLKSRIYSIYAIETNHKYHMHHSACHFQHIPYL